MYASDNFIEKNLDQLPQDAAELLKSSLNPVLQLDLDNLLAMAGGMQRMNISSSSTDNADMPPPPSMSAYVTRPKADPVGNLKAVASPGPKMAFSGGRRGSMGKAVPYSVVAQLRTELSVMMTHINTTVNFLCIVYLLSPAYE